MRWKVKVHQDMIKSKDVEFPCHWLNLHVVPLCLPHTVSSTWREELSVNSAGWTDISMKISDQMSGGMEGTKWNTIPTHHRTPPKHQHWAQGTQGTNSTVIRFLSLYRFHSVMTRTGS